MRFGRYIVGLPSLDNDALLASRPRDEAKSIDENEDVNGTDHSDADAIV